MRNNILVLTLAMVFLSACSGGVVKQITLQDTPKADPIIPQPLQLEMITWKAYSREDFIFLDENEVVFVLTKEEKKKLDDNLLEWRRHTLQMKEAILFNKN